MNRAALEKRWSQVRDRLDAAARLLTDPARRGEEGGASVAYREWAKHNELELALDELESLGEERDAPDAYWLELAKAASLMGLEANAARCRSRRRGSER